jgi:hypothetical protein
MQFYEVTIMNPNNVPNSAQLPQWATPARLVKPAANDSTIDDSSLSQSLSVSAIEQKLNEKHKEIIAFCKEERKEPSFYKEEKLLMTLVSQLGVLYLQLFLSVCHSQLDYSLWLESGWYYLSIQLKERTIDTNGTYLRNFTKK